MADIVGTPGDDVLNGTAGSDTITGLAGNDTLSGGDESDFLDGGEGSDTLYGGLGNDLLVNRNGGDDRLYGGDGDDFLQVSVGSVPGPIINMVPGPWVTIPPATLLLDAGNGDDWITYFAFDAQTATYRPNGDVLTVLAGDGNDRLDIRPVTGATINLGSGNDLLTFDLSSSNTAITLGTGADFVDLQRAGFQLGTESKLPISKWELAATSCGYRDLKNGYAVELTNGNPFTSGHLRVVQSGADSLVQLDEDGAAGPGAFQTIVILRNVTAANLTQDNFGFAPDGSVPVARTIDGTEGRDFLAGQGAGDIIRGLGGDDWIFGNWGNDTIYGGDGRDILDGGLGNDFLEGEDGDDSLSSYSPGNDALYGGAGQDSLSVSLIPGPGIADVLLDGGPGGDRLSYFRFGQATDTVRISGGDGNDYIYVSRPANVVIDSGLDNDEVGVDILSGTVSIATAQGADSISLISSIYATQTNWGLVTVNDFSAVDRLSFGRIFTTALPNFDGINANRSGHLRILQDGADTVLQHDRDGGADNFVTFVRLVGVVASSLTPNQLYDGVTAVMPVVGRLGTAGADNFVGTAAIDHYYGASGNDIIAGGDGDDVLAGEAGDDGIEGGNGSDALLGGDGADRLDGGVGADQLYGGFGSDTFIVDQQNDILFEYANGGTDTAESSGNYYLYANIENLTLTGTANNFGVGNELANVLTGNAGENLLIAGAGNDTVNGGGARDAIFGEDGADTLNGEAGIDYIVAGIGNDTLDGGADADEMYGQEGDDIMRGGASFDTDIIVGGLGNDTIYGNSGLGDYDRLYGNEGNDIFYVDTPDDLVFEQGGEGTDTVYADINGAGYYLYGNIENLILLDDTPFGVGNDLDNRLTGSATGNYLLGGAGNDTLNGLGGNDVLFGETGNDVFVFNQGTGGDVIGDFARGQDRIDVSAYGMTFAQLQARFVQNGNVGAIQMTNGDVIVLHNVTMSQLTASDFILTPVSEAAPKSEADIGGAFGAGALLDRVDAISYADHGLQRWQPVYEGCLL